MPSLEQSEGTVRKRNTKQALQHTSHHPPCSTASCSAGISLMQLQSSILASTPVTRRWGPLHTTPGPEAVSLTPQKPLGFQLAITSIQQDGATRYPSERLLTHQQFFLLWPCNSSSSPHLCSFHEGTLLTCPQHSGLEICHNFEWRTIWFYSFNWKSHLT